MECALPAQSAGPCTLLWRAEPFSATKIETLRMPLLLLLVALHFVHFCPGHGLLVSSMSPSAMPHFVAGHLVLANLVLLHLSAVQRQTVGIAGTTAVKANKMEPTRAARSFLFSIFRFLLRCVTLARRSPRRRDPTYPW